MTTHSEAVCCPCCHGAKVIDLNANVTSNSYNYVPCPECLGRGYTAFQASMFNLLSLALGGMRGPDVKVDQD